MIFDPAVKSEAVFLISGTPGSGKTSVSQSLLQNFSLGLHLPLDDFREFVVSGRASIFNWSEETTRQFALARETAVAATLRYVEAGFAVALDDVVFPAETETLYMEPLHAFSVYKVLLLPKLAVVLKRNTERTNKRFETSALATTIRNLHKTFTEQEDDFRAAGWLVIDSSELTLEQTVAHILTHTVDRDSTKRRLE